MVNKSVREKYPSTSFCKGLTKSANKIKLNNKTLKLELDQWVIKEVIDESYKILHRDRLHLENIPSSDTVNFTEENLDKNLSFIKTQETLLTKSQGSFNNTKSESPLILSYQKERDNVRAKILALKSFFMNEIYDLRQEISSIRSQLEQERLHHSGNKDCAEEKENIKQESRQITFMSDKKSALKGRN